MLFCTCSMYCQTQHQIHQTYSVQLFCSSLSDVITSVLNSQSVELSHCDIYHEDCSSHLFYSVNYMFKNCNDC
ncbi:hypothetical protein EMPG_12417 [Blastomyces silverae]|uniref:Uncharacterized protein n=1 Tax=Blastomyces silverae TaxID=2060906 RepID=A0A0H1BM08_9EURO|nr:hypothetical protein EMPG_12417 [Blastomyces silverae]